MVSCVLYRPLQHFTQTYSMESHVQPFPGLALSELILQTCVSVTKSVYIFPSSKYNFVYVPFLLSKSLNWQMQTVTNIQKISVLQRQAPTLMKSPLMHTLKLTSTPWNLHLPQSRTPQFPLLHLLETQFSAVNQKQAWSLYHPLWT